VGETEKEDFPSPGFSGFLEKAILSVGSNSA